eukprot:UN32120
MDQFRMRENGVERRLETVSEENTESPGERVQLPHGPPNSDDLIILDGDASGYNSESLTTDTGSQIMDN